MVNDVVNDIHHRQARTVHTFDSEHHNRYRNQAVLNCSKEKCSTNFVFISRQTLSDAVRWMSSSRSHQRSTDGIISSGTKTFVRIFDADIWFINKIRIIWVVIDDVIVDVALKTQDEKTNSTIFISSVWWSTKIFRRDWKRLSVYRLVFKRYRFVETEKKTIENQWIWNIKTRSQNQKSSDR